MELETPWFDGELFIHTFMTDVAFQASWCHMSSEAQGPQTRPFVKYPKDFTWPIERQNTNTDLFYT